MLTGRYACLPDAHGYQPNLASEMGEMQERITSTKKGSITSVQAIYVPADDYTDPAPANAFAHLDATTNLSRDIAALGIYPAVDRLASTSRILDARIIGDEHDNVAQAVKGFREIVPGKHDSIPEQTFYMQGTIEEVLEKAEQMREGS